MLNELNAPTTLLQSYITWLINLSPGTVATVTLCLFFALFVIVECNSPREKHLSKHLRQSYRTNLGLYIFNSVVMTLLSVPALLILAAHTADKGVLNSVSNPGWKAVFSFLAIDLLLYLLHKASHTFDCLWMFHKVHHNDPFLNVSTAFRLHFLEILIINLMKAVLIVVLGIDGALLLVNETITTVFTMLHHTNITLRGEQLLGRVMITPYLHRVHHSTQRHEHDRNYGAVLSIWDRWFGTLAALKPAAIGLKGSSPQGLFKLVIYGLTRIDNASAHPVGLEDMIAEAAYYKAEKRGFYPGNELRDWLDAKREIIREGYAEKQLKNIFIQKWLDFVGGMNRA